MSEKTRYVLGFLFSGEHHMYGTREVVLINKNRPAWQKGFLNGVGGKVEAGESWSEAMAREFREEAGLDLEWGEPRLFLRGPKFEMAVFSLIGPTRDAKQMTDEPIKIVPVKWLYGAKTISNLQWIIPFLLDDSDGKGNLLDAEVNYA